MRGDFAVKREKIDSHDPDGQFPHAFDDAVQDVAALHRSDAGGRSGKDQVARRQSEELRKLGDDFGNIPDQGREVRTLDALAIAFQRERPLLGWPILLASATAEHGAERSKAFPASQGRAIF